MRSVLILGGYGNFGQRIAKALASASIPIIIAGRDAEKASRLAKNLQALYPQTNIRFVNFDANKNLDQFLEELSPVVVINTVGPFQNSDYRVAETCMRYGVHYIDLADGRDFVTDFNRLNKQAEETKVSLITGASSVPALSSCVIDHYKNHFLKIEQLKYGISPGQKAQRGLATTQAILGYIGKPLKMSKAMHKKRYGWQDIYRQDYPELGKRWMANCDIPDLDLFPSKYNIQSIQFSAGMETTSLHFSIWSLSWLIRLGLPLKLEKHATFLLKMSHLFDWLGTADGGMHLILEGLDLQEKPLRKEWFIIAKNGDGPQIPTIPAIILAKEMIKNPNKFRKGAYPCMGLFSLDDYLAELKQFDIKTYDNED